MPGEMNEFMVGHIARRAREGADPEAIVAELMGMGVPEAEARATLAQFAAAPRKRTSNDGWWLYLAIPVVALAVGLVAYGAVAGFEAVRVVLAVASMVASLVGMGICLWLRRMRQFGVADASWVENAMMGGAVLAVSGVVVLVLLIISGGLPEDVGKYLRPEEETYYEEDEGFYMDE